MKTTRTRTIQAAEVGRRIESAEPVLFVEVHSPGALPPEGKIPGALRIAPTEIDDLIDQLPPSYTVVVYSSDELAARRVVERLQSQGYRGVFALDGGYEGWVEAGFEVMPREVMEALGTLP